MSKRITSKLPAATLAQRLAAMSETELAFAARQLALQPESDAACTADTFQAFVAEIDS
jgi:hypothetical protein